MKQKRLGLFDTDSLLYAAAWASTIKDIRYEDDEKPQDVLNPDKACEVLDDKIRQWAEAAEVDDYRLAVSDTVKTHRYFIWPDYKANRKGMPKPELYQIARKHLFDNYSKKIVMLPRLEGDDVISMFDTGPWHKVVVSIDKDMKQLPGELIVPKGEDDFNKLLISPREADWSLWFQVLTGDATDGFWGAPGIGQVGAQKNLDGMYGRGVHAYYERCLKVYQEQRKHKRWGAQFVHDDPQQELLMNLNLVRLLRMGDYVISEATGATQVRYYNPVSVTPHWIGIPDGGRSDVSTEQGHGHGDVPEVDEAVDGEGSVAADGDRQCVLSG